MKHRDRHHSAPHHPAPHGRAAGHGPDRDGRPLHRRRRKPFDYGALRLFLLALIEERPRHGYELIRAIEERTAGRYVPSPGVIYPTLAWLDDMGFVAAESGAGRKSHRITAEGRAFLAANGKAVRELLARDWSQENEDEGDEIRAGMHAVKSALRDLLKDGEPGPELRIIVGRTLAAAARTIRTQSGLDQAPAGTDHPPARHRVTTEEASMEQIITRHRFDTRRRTLAVAEKTWLTPRMIRLVLTGEDLGDFQSLAPDDHVKLFFDTGADKPEMRDYTPRAFDREAGRLTLDFAVHEAGPATRWAIDAQPGDRLGIGGPRGSAVVAPVFDWYLLIGDETALPAIGRWVEEAPAGQTLLTLGLVTDAAEEQEFATAATHLPHWLHRADAADPAPALAAIRALDLPQGRGFVWIAAEAGVARALRDHVLTQRNHPREALKAAGYWRKGQADAHEKLLD